MKKLLLSFCAIVAFTTSSFARPGWQISVIDACGGFLGAATGSVFGPAGTVFGYWAGGVGASLAASRVANPPHGGGSTGPTNPDNPFGGGGVKHNEACDAYYNAGTPSDISGFVMQEAQQLGISIPTGVSPTFPEEIANEVNAAAFNTPDDVYNFLTAHSDMPDALKPRLRTAITSILNTTSPDEFSTVLLQQQRIILGDPSLNGTLKDQLTAWFAILYSSYFFWIP